MLQSAKDPIITSPEISDKGSSATCLAASEAMHALRDAISGSLFLHNYLRGHLFYLELWLLATRPQAETRLTAP